MSNKNSTLTHARLRELLHYDPRGGVFTRLVAVPRCPVGSIAGRVNRDGYLTVKIDNRNHLCHRLAWLYMTGEWPKKFITHLNQDRSDNRFENLGEAQTYDKKDITSDEARQMFDYNPHTGSLKWKNKRSGVSSDREAGCFEQDGYRQIRVNGASIRAHRLVWLIVTGDWPSKHIDHINGIKSDNRFANLRDVDNTTNRQNVKGAFRSNKTTGLLGVHLDRGKFRARIRSRGKSIHLGRFDTAHEAHEAYLDAKRRLHAGCLI